MGYLNISGGTIRGQYNEWGTSGGTAIIYQTGGTWAQGGPAVGGGGGVGVSTYTLTGGNLNATASVGYGVFERAWAIRGMEDLLADAAAEPDAAEALFERVAEHQMQILELVLELPVDGVRFSDDWSDQRGIMLGPDRWRTMLKPRVARLYGKAKSAGKFTLQHCCGNLSDVVPDLIEIGLDVLQSVQPEAMDVYKLKRDYGRDITFWGGVGSQSILPFGTPDQIRAEVRKLVTEMGRGGGYILGPAKSVLADTPPANFAALLESFLEYSGHA